MPVILFYYCFISCVADPSWSSSFQVSTLPPGPISLQALHSASRLHHSMGSLVIIMYICVLILFYAGTYLALWPY